MDLFQFVRQLSRLPDLLGWRREGLLVNVVGGWRGLSQIVFHLVIILELIGNCWEGWLGLFRFAIRSVVLLELVDVPRWIVESSVVIVGNYCWRNLLWLAFGWLPDFLDWKIDAFWLNFLENVAFYFGSISNLAEALGKIKLYENIVS